MPKSSPRIDIVRVANAQKFLLWTILLVILVNVSMTGVSGFLHSANPPRPREVMILFEIAGTMITVGLIVLQIASVVRLCLAQKEGWTTIIYAVLQIAPCLSLILLLFLNGRATAQLKAAGIKVGLMGARQRDLDNYQTPQTRNCPGCGESIEMDVAICPLCGYAVG